MVRGVPFPPPASIIDDIHGELMQQRREAVITAKTVLGDDASVAHIIAVAEYIINGLPERREDDAAGHPHSTPGEGNPSTRAVS